MPLLPFRPDSTLAKPSGVVWYLAVPYAVERSTGNMLSPPAAASLAISPAKNRANSNRPDFPGRWL